MSKRKASSELSQPKKKSFSREVQLRTGGNPWLRRSPNFQGRVRKNTSNVATLMSYPMPQKCRTQLKFREDIGLISALTSSSSSVFRPTSYFDADPVIGGGTFSGYTFFASMYGRYRVTSFSYKATFVNLENTSVIVSCQAIASGLTPGSGTATDYTEAAVENDYGQYEICAPAASSPKQVITGYVDCVKLWGTPEAKTAEGWGSQTGTSPGANSWLRVAAHMANNLPMTVGVQCILELQSYGYWDEKVADVVS